MLKIENLNTGYDKKQVLYDVSLEVKQGDIALLIGSNGSGKSTLLKAIYGLCKVWRGNVFFENENITNNQSSSLLKSGLLYVPQKNNLFEQLTVKENLEISGLALNNNQLFKLRLNEISNLFPFLVSNYKMYPMKMSGGERQQLVLAMALIHNPKLLLLDEPFTGLSPNTIELVAGKIHQINKEKNTTILMIEHRIKEALPLANQLLGLKLGKIVENNTNNSNFDDSLLNQILI